LFFAAGADPAPAHEPFCRGSVPSKDRAPHYGLLEVVGDHVGEEFPEAAPEGIGAGELFSGWIEGGWGMEERNGFAAPAVEAFDGALGE